MRLGEFTANIIVDGKELEEYDVVSENPTQVTCWVASEGKSFGVQWKCHEERRVTGIQGCVAVDGIGCVRGLCMPGVLGNNDGHFSTQYLRGNTRRKLMFARVQLSDDDALLDKAVPKDLGNITVTIARGEFSPTRRHPISSRKVSIQLDGTEKFHERSKKATAHRVGFGPTLVRERSKRKWKLTRNGEPTIVFVFKYRPLDVLQANGIAPRTTSTDASASIGSEDAPVERDVGIPDTVEDIKLAPLDDRIQNLENELKRLRALRAGGLESEDRKPKRIKTEPQERKQPVFTSGEIIDLT